MGFKLSNLLPNFIKNPGQALFGSPYKSPQRQDAMAAQNAYGSLATDYRNQLRQAQQQQGLYDKQFGNQVQQYVAELNSPLDIERQRNLRFGGGVDLADQAYRQAGANLSAQLARRGIGGGIEAGALSNLAGQRAAAVNKVANDAATWAMNEKLRRQGMATSLLGSTRGMYANEARGALSGLGSNYGNQFSMATGMAQQDEAARNAHRQQINQLLGGLGQAAGTLGGGFNIGNIFGGGRAQSPSYGPGYGGQQFNTVQASDGSQWYQGPDGQWYPF